MSCYFTVSNDEDQGKRAIRMDLVFGVTTMKVLISILYRVLGRDKESRRTFLMDLTKLLVILF